MAYDLQLVQINTGVGGLKLANTGWGFPVSTNFHTMLMSYWMCGPNNPGHGTPGIWPAFDSAQFFTFDPGISRNITLTNGTLGAFGHFFQGTFSLPPPPGMLLHLMMSVDTHAQVVQVYINDISVPVAGTWTGAQPLDFNVGNTVNIWAWNASGVSTSSLYPALADAWISNTPSFVDLSVAANRRKFITAGLTAVDLGNTGTTPFGYQPAMYMSVRPGGVPTDILTNRGIGGGAWNYDPPVPTFQAPGVCTLPTPPTTPKLAMDDVVCVADTMPLSKNLISLEWSDDRGHSWGSPVSQSIGEIGEYRTSLQWQRLGLARDRCFRLSWSVPMPTALQGCWFDAQPAQS